MGRALMASKRDRKDNVNVDITKAIIDRYDPKNAEDMHAAIKDIFGPMFEALLQGEMDAHLGYGNNDHTCLPRDIRTSQPSSRKSTGRPA